MLVYSLRMTHPYTRTEDISENIYGHVVRDPYRWLENENSPEIQQWVKDQNEYTFSKIKISPEFKIFSNELIRNFDVTDFDCPVPVHGRYFYMERRPGQEQSVLYYTDGLRGNPITLVDPHRIDKNGTATIDAWKESPTGKYVAYVVSEKGAEMGVIYIKTVSTGENLTEIISHCRHSSIRWLPDDSGFFYTRNPRPGTVPANEEHLHAKVYFHHLGDNPETDELIFGAGRPKDDMINITISPDGAFLGIGASQKWTEKDIYLYDINRKKLSPLIIGKHAKFSLALTDTHAFLTTNHQANNYRVLSTSRENIFAPLEEWEEIIPESKDVLEYIVATKERILAVHLVNAQSKISVYDHHGTLLNTIHLPPYSSITGITARKEEDEFFYAVASFFFPRVIYRYNPTTNTYEEYRATKNPINPEEYEATQEWFASKDGTKVPMFIVRKKNASLDNASRPTILYGYGGFGSVDGPGFLRNQIPWLERGGIFAIANIRGNGEFGEAWHVAGTKQNKQKSFDDFIAAGEYLIKHGYTDAKHLGILGGSNGGLLVAAVAVQRPDLFAAVCSRVPLTDMVRFPRFGIALRWTHEYGDPTVQEDLNNILLWSPYHNVAAEKEYPNFLFTTGMYDTRVNPLHARKMAALLQATNKKNDVFLFTEIDAGHGSGKPVKKIIEGQALVLTFFSQKLGLAVY